MRGHRGEFIAIILVRRHTGQTMLNDAFPARPPDESPLLSW